MEIATEKATIGIVQRLLKVIVGPNRAFNAIKEDPRILMPAVIILSIIVLFEILTLSIIGQQSIEQIGSLAEQSGSSIFTTAMLSAATVIGKLFVWLAQALVLLIYNQVSLGEGSFKHFYAIAIYTTVPGVIKQIVTFGLIIVFGFNTAIEANTSFAVLLGNDTGSFLYRFLSFFDLFSFWAVILLALGGAVVMKKNFKGLVIYLFALWIALSLAGTFLTGLIVPFGMKLG